MMTEFFTIYTYTPWDNLNSNQLTQIRALSLKKILKNFPIIEASFFDDLQSNVYNNNQYSWIESIKRIVGPNNEDYDISNWNFLYAFDDQRRLFQFLLQKKNEQGILVAIAPPELAKLFSDHGKGAILKTLSLLNKPSKIKFLMILGPKGKSIAQEQQLIRMNRQQYDKFKLLQKTPNMEGLWFPSYEPRCPICNELLREISGLDYKIGLGKIVCPRCGYRKTK